jgi:CRISPR-associated protein Cas5d
MWTRPDTGDCPVSYPVPTYSAAKGVFESILWGPAVRIVPTRVDICAPVIYHSYQTNYGGPLRKQRIIETGGGFQFLATVLIDVCYRLYADVWPAKSNDKSRWPEKAQKWDRGTTAPGHAYQSIFERRLKRGQCFTLPFLGWKEFAPSYWGPFRPQTHPQESLQLTLPSMLREVFSTGYASTPEFVYDQNVTIEKGSMIFPSQGAAHA